MEGRPQGLPRMFDSLDEVATHMAEGLLEKRKGDIPADVPIRDTLIDHLLRTNTALEMVR